MEDTAYVLYIKQSLGQCYLFNLIMGLFYVEWVESRVVISAVKYALYIKLSFKQPISAHIYSSIRCSWTATKVKINATRSHCLYLGQISSLLDQVSSSPLLIVDVHLNKKCLTLSVQISSKTSILHVLMEFAMHLQAMTCINSGCTVSIEVSI